MKLFNKLISAMCAVGIVATMASSLVLVHAAEELPKLSLDVQWTDKEAGTGTITASIEGLQLPLDSEGNPVAAKYAHLASWQMYIGVDGENVFDTTLWENELAMYMNCAASEFTSMGTFTSGTYLTPTKTIQPNFMLSSTQAMQLLVKGFADPTKIGDKMNLFTLNFTVKDASKLPTEITLSNVEFRVEAKDASGKLMSHRLFGNATPDDEAMTIVDSTKFPAAVKPSVPENTGTTADSNTIKAFNPKDLGLTETADGYFTPDADYANANDRAIAVANNFAAPGEFNKIKWTMSRTPVGGVAETASLTKPIANIDTNAAITVGMVVGFDISQYSAVSITNVELINE